MVDISQLDGLEILYPEKYILQNSIKIIDIFPLKFVKKPKNYIDLLQGHFLYIKLGNLKIDV